MDTKMQSLPITHAQKHSSSRHHSRNCSQCRCSHRQGPASHHCPPSHRSPPNRRSQSPSPSLPPRHHKHTTYCNHSSTQPTTHYGTHSKKKSLGGMVSKRKIKKNRRMHKTKKQSSGHKCN